MELAWFGLASWRLGGGGGGGGGVAEVYRGPCVLRVRDGGLVCRVGMIEGLGSDVWKLGGAGWW